IPFEALVDEQNRFLVEAHSFSYLTNGRDLLRLQVPRNSRSNALVVVDPSFGEPEPKSGSKVGTPAPSRNRARGNRSVTSGAGLDDVYFAPLGGTEQEGQAIKSLFPEATLITGAQATEASLKQVAAPRILHIATHGFFLTDEPSG